MPQPSKESTHNWCRVRLRTDFAWACEAKRSATKYILTGLPSLQPHMYQESVLRIERASESIGHLTAQRRLYAPANNPFAVAQVLHDLVSGEQSGSSGSGASDQNLYLCPVGPKPHVLGFALFYLREMQGRSASIIYPFAEGLSEDDHRRSTQDLAVPLRIVTNSQDANAILAG